MSEDDAAVKTVKYIAKALAAMPALILAVMACAYVGVAVDTGDTLMAQLAAGICAAFVWLRTTK